MLAFSLSRLLLKCLSPGQGWLRTLWVGRAQCSSGCDLHFHPLSLSNPGGRAALIYLPAIKRPASPSNTLGRAARLHNEGGSQKHTICHRCEYTDCLLKSRIDMKIKRCTETAYLQNTLGLKNIKFIIDKAQKRTTHTALNLSDAFLHLNEAVNGA